MVATINISQADLDQAYSQLGQHMADVISKATETGIKNIVQSTISSVAGGGMSNAGQKMYVDEFSRSQSDFIKTLSEQKTVLKESTDEQIKTVELTKKQNQQLEETIKKRTVLEQEYSQIEEKIKAGKTQDKNIGLKNILSSQESSRYKELEASISSLKADEGLIGQGFDPTKSAAESGGGGFFSRNAGMIMAGAMMGPFSPVAMGLGLFKKTIGQFTDEIVNYNENTRKASVEVSKIYTVSQQEDFGHIMTKKMKGLFDAINTNDMLKGWGFTDEAQAAIVSYMRANADNFDDMVKTSGDKLIKPIISIAAESKMAGLSIADFTKHILDMKYKQNISSEEARARIIQSTDLEKKLNLEQGTLIAGIQSTYDSLSTLGFRISDSTGLMAKFATSVQKGEMSMGDIVNYAKGLSGADEGGQVFLLQRMAENGNAIAQRIVEKYSNDPLAMAEAAKGAFQGSSVVAKDLGVNARSMSRLFREGQFGVAKQMAGDGGRISELAMMRKILSMFNMELPENIDIAQTMTAGDFKYRRQTIDTPEISKKLYENMDRAVGGIDKFTASISAAAIQLANLTRKQYDITGIDEYESFARKYITNKQYSNVGAVLSNAAGDFGDYGEVKLGNKLAATILDPEFIKGLKASVSPENIPEVTRNIYGLTLKDPGIDAMIKLLQTIKTKTSSESIRKAITSFGTREHGAIVKQGMRELGANRNIPIIKGGSTPGM